MRFNQNMVRTASLAVLGPEASRLDSTTVPRIRDLWRLPSNLFALCGYEHKCVRKGQSATPRVGLLS